MSTHLDMSLIAELQSLMEDDFANLLETYLTDSETRRIQIREAVNASNATDIRTSAHGLKGSSSNIGATHLTVCCQTLEEHGRSNHLQGIEQALSAVEAELDIVQAELRALIQHH